MMINRAGLKMAAIVIVLLLALNSALAQESYVVVEVLDGGLVRVAYSIEIGGGLALSVPLIGSPDPSLLIMVTDEKGEPLAYEINQTSRTIEVAGINASKVEITYYTQTITYKQGKFWYVNFSSPYRVKVILPPNATITDLNRVPEEVAIIEGRVTLTFSAGPVIVEYTFTYAPPSGEGAAEGDQVSGAESSQQTTQQEEQKEESRQPVLPLSIMMLVIYAIVAVAVIAAIAAVVVAKRRKESLALLEELGEDDMAIVEALRRLGGEAFQSELQKTLGMPTTTLWRRLRKLERLGLIEIRKRAGRNYVKLRI